MVGEGNGGAGQHGGATPAQAMAVAGAVGRSAAADAHVSLDAGQRAGDEEPHFVSSPLRAFDLSEAVVAKLLRKQINPVLLDGFLATWVTPGCWGMNTNKTSAAHRELLLGLDLDGFLVSRSKNHKAPGFARGLSIDELAPNE